MKPKLKQIFTRNGIERFDPLGEKFDPTQHEAMFEVPDDEKESGIVAHIVEPGYKISDRFNISYSYGLPSSDWDAFTGSHEFMLGVKLPN